MPFTLPPLPYDRAALAAAAGMRRHSLLGGIFAARPGPLRNNAGQGWHHSFFWPCMAPNSGDPNGQLVRSAATTGEARCNARSHMINGAIG